MSPEPLSARVASATGPDRELDAEVGRAIGGVPKIKPVWRRNHYPLQKIRDKEGWPRFTASVDAALTTIPARWHVTDAHSNGGLWCVTLGFGDMGHPEYREVFSWPGDAERGIFHRKPLAIAILAASLKARGL